MNVLLEMASGADLTTAVIDLITGLILIPLILIFLKQEGDKKLKRLWFITLLLLSVADIFGFLVHAFIISELTFDIIWIFLYAMMFGLSLSFAMLSVIVLSSGKRPSKNERFVAYIITFIVYLAAVIIGFNTVNEIRTYVIYAALIDLPAFLIYGYLAIKNKRKSGLIMLAAIPLQIFGLIFQLTKKGGFTLGFEFNHDGIYHLCLLVTVVLISIAAMYDIKEKY